MATSSEPNVIHDPDPVRVVRQFSAIPPWLAAALDADQVMRALNRHVPEFASGMLTLRDCAIDQLHLKDTNGEWGRNWMLTVADADGERLIPIRVSLLAPGLPAKDQPVTTLSIDSGDWQCWLSEVGLLCKRGRFKRDKELPSLKVLTDAEHARSLLKKLYAHRPPATNRCRSVPVGPRYCSTSQAKAQSSAISLTTAPKALGRAGTIRSS